MVNQNKTGRSNDSWSNKPDVVSMLESLANHIKRSYSVYCKMVIYL